MNIEAYAKKTFLALKNPYGTVRQVWPGVIDRVRPSLQEHGYAYYTGYKQTETLPETLVRELESRGFLRHTRDRMALGGRAIDLRLVNPLTGKWMSGSSSGTALNVFYGINDLGVGTDGGGSVLAPAASLNLYGFISPLIEQEHMRRFFRQSTDGIGFSPSVGFLTRDIETLIRAVCGEQDWRGAERSAGYHFVKVPESVDIYGARETLIPYVRETVKGKTILISEEGPVDVLGMGDSVFGHFDETTEAVQRAGKKGLMRVANMCGVSAVSVPGRELGKCTLLLCAGEREVIAVMLARAEQISAGRSPLVERYFMNLDMYFEE